MRGVAKCNVTRHPAHLVSETLPMKVDGSVDSGHKAAQHSNPIKSRISSSSENEHKAPVQRGGPAAQVGTQTLRHDLNRLLFLEPILVMTIDTFYQGGKGSVEKDSFHKKPRLSKTRKPLSLL